ncbi:YhcB family protein [Vreelandella neptunia]|uniref:YhcB family protein n=1 Tax=Vreelandella neptunia TaxID=115551 RepID=A0ABS9S272_9GAMM|nr:YhcB family protein [Halomonas neptunia]
MDASSPLTIAIIGFIVGLIVGLGCYRLFSKSQREAASMRQKLLEREHQIAEMKSSVGSHLTGIYQRLGNIRDEANQLELQLKEDAAEWNIRDAAIQPSLDLSGINETTQQAQDDPAAPATPRDYADGKGGTLSEDFGLKSNEAATPQPPRY